MIFQRKIKIKINVPSLIKALKKSNGHTVHWVKHNHKQLLDENRELDEGYAKLDSLEKSGGLSPAAGRVGSFSKS